MKLGIMLLVLLAGIYGSIFSPETWAQDATAQPDCVRICLPQESTNGLPSAAFIDAVNEAVVGHTGATFCVVSKLPELTKSAKVILHSYGVAEEQIRLTTAADDCPEIKKSPASSVTNAPRFQTAFVVLGNRPLDDSTPTVDMLQRIFTAIPNVKGRPGVALILTGGPTEGPISEAKMMALVALSRGVAHEQIFLEEESWTTGRNAAFTAPIVERLGLKSVFIVSKQSHLSFAMEEFRRYDAFRRAVPLESPEVREQSIRQMADYLKRHDKPDIRSRLEALKADSHGVD